MLDERSVRIGRTVALKAAAESASRLLTGGEGFERAFDYLYAKFCAELEVARPFIVGPQAKMLAKLRPWGSRAPSPQTPPSIRSQ